MRRSAHTSMPTFTSAASDSGPRTAESGRASRLSARRRIRTTTQSSRVEAAAWRGCFRVYLNDEPPPAGLRLAVGIVTAVVGFAVVYDGVRL